MTLKTDQKSLMAKKCFKIIDDLKIDNDVFRLINDVIHVYFRPFGQCAEVLTPQTVEQYFLPIVVSITVKLII